MACAALMVGGSGVLRADVDISANIEINSPSDFYQPLQPYGTWVDVSPYGRCWHPTDVQADWQPYTTGHWEWTDQGWYWVSDEPWGWACCHYGSWYDDANVGWIWIPGTEWAPAWVTWRDSDDYIGWAPCGPGRAVLAPSFFTFCDVHHFRDHFHSRGDFIVNNTRIVNRTRVINNFNRETINLDGRQRTIFANKGPGIDPIRRATGRDITPRPVRDVIRETARPEDMRRGNAQRPDQRPTEQPRRETPAPTGREQQRNYEQQRNIQQRNNQQVAPQTPERNRQIEQRTRPDMTPTTPTGREQQRNYQQPTPRAPEQNRQPQRVQPEQRAPETPQTRPQATPPTGREAPRVYREPNRPEVPNPAPEQRREIPTPEQRPAAPPERALPPTGRQEAPHMQPREVAPPAREPQARPAPPVQQDGHGQDGRDGRNRHDGTP
jgi:hypothetical protein